MGTKRWIVSNVALDSRLVRAPRGLFLSPRDPNDIVDLDLMPIVRGGFLGLNNGRPLPSSNGLHDPNPLLAPLPINVLLDFSSFDPLMLRELALVDVDMFALYVLRILRTNLPNLFCAISSQPLGLT